MGDAAVYDLAAVVAERDALKAEVAQADAEYQDAITLAQSNKDRLDVALAEVARLSAACAAKDAALQAFEADQVPHDMALEMREAALSDDAGRNYIDATGAVEATVRLWSISPSCYGQGVNVAVPDDWAGSKVLIVVKP